MNIILSSEKVLYNRGYIITSRNEYDGLITAEYYTTTPLQEDQAPVQPSGPSAGQVILVILGIICIVGLIYIVVDAINSPKNSSTDNERHHNNDNHAHYQNNDERTSVAYKYVMNLRTTVLTDTTSRLEAHLTKVVIENGTPVSSAAIESSATINNFFESLENELAFVR